MGSKMSAVQEEGVVLWSRSVLLPVVLGIIAAEGESHGYRIKQLIERAGLRRPADGALYPLLREAEDINLLYSSWRREETKPDRLVYRLTPEGVRRLRAERQLWSTFIRDVSRLLKAGAIAVDDFDRDSDE
ncbi:PadR family transcriptional regulator [Microbacterium sp. NPDC091662]|uniref:PadR family transcriptional regulator n=1 Tax=Microbacterium sp. NPDC091662 TaxID=3364211 RepID=UPI00380AA01D